MPDTSLVAWLRRFWRWRPTTTRAVVAWQLFSALVLFATAFGLRAGTGEPVGRSLLVAAVTAAAWTVVGVPIALARLRRDQ